MQAIRVNAFGGEENLKLQNDVSIPTPGNKEVLIRVAAAGVNPVDTYIRAGTFSVVPPLPYTPGLDCAGTIEDVGADVTGFKKGDRVYTVTSVSGTYAEYATAEARVVNHLPEKLSFAQGAAIGVPYYTVAKALYLKSEIKAGETVLIHGASGAVGLAAIQMSKAMGLKVVGTAGTKDGMDLVKKIGADLVFNHRDQGYIQAIKDSVGGIDIILEMLANVNLQTDLEILNTNGRVMIIGCRGDVEINPRLIIGREAIVTGIFLLLSDDEEYRKMHEIVRKDMQDGWIVPQIAKTYPLVDAGKAHYDIINNQGTMGRLVLDTAN